jgi:hypothetical protein
MIKIVSFVFLSLLLSFAGSCAYISSVELVSADPISASVINGTSLSDVTNSCPVILKLPLPAAIETPLSSVIQKTQSPNSQTESQGIPSPVTTAPGYGCIVFTLTPQMQWNGYQDTSTYSLQIAIDQYFTNLVLNESGITAFYYDVPSDTFGWNKAYYWRVNISDKAGATSAWSYPGYFSAIQEFGFHT